MEKSKQYDRATRQHFTEIEKNSSELKHTLCNKTVSTRNIISHGAPWSVQHTMFAAGTASAADCANNLAKVTLFAENARKICGRVHHTVMT